MAQKDAPKGFGRTGGENPRIGEHSASLSSHTLSSTLVLF